MELKYADVNDLTVIDLEGRLTLGDGSTLELRDSIRDLLAQGRKNILLNLAGITYIDSAGVALLIQAYKYAQDLHGDVKLLKLDARVDNMMQITKLYRVFDIFEDARTAIAAFVRSESRVYPGQARAVSASDDPSDGENSPVPA
jgi:anti-sigma B factor antagonist